ncbi:MAG: hypothetical protein ABSC89_06285 [Verrucomicrobiota bacterium]
MNINVSGSNPSWGWSASTTWFGSWSTPTYSITRPSTPDGVELKSTNSSVLAATNLPYQTTVSNIMRGVHPSNRRGSQWLSVVGQPITAGKFYPSVTFFRLCDAFDISFTNDVVLQITPLIYKVETNEVTAHLVEFPPIKMKLLSNGEVQKLP